MEGYLTPEETQRKRMSNQYGFNTSGFETTGNDGEVMSRSSARLYKAGEGGGGLDQGSQDTPSTPKGNGYNQQMGQELAKGATQAMSGGGGMGQTLTSAGMYATMSGNPMVGVPLIAGGMLMSSSESKNAAKAAAEKARVDEANQRKQNVQAALNQALQASGQLGV
ncbi:MAG: hypothetical protein RIQ94_196 [Pseudomonadota bacterium]|jgi:hypothetical protein